MFYIIPCAINTFSVDSFYDLNGGIYMKHYKQILRYGDLTERGYGSRTTIWRAIALGSIPQPSNFMGRPGWTLETIEEFENSRPQLQSKEPHSQAEIG